ncbi:MAG: hypothetical protein A2751_05600 [Candidatus Doudnabacteria bacterium RIFCSPHIGHO2_01_FULL_46_14]|uniref:Uncharacterized protein n=1 Tax=Candidatus Doudnabacteria bacterium RIFCSPHIGHO2_01_FULL_46_14 TaxID=1817824 RepID=A0A1F5NN32_9BACT|nr:MAG: hypothetical protein A2751_05600 [Candidatus Doudnabacteria bacterium RIFCSPHIGHO2_01_FULL_46_14]
MAIDQDYKKLIEEIISKQMDILGPEIAIRKATNVAGLKLSDKGEVLSIDENNAQAILQKLVDEYIALSGAIVKNILNPVFAKYPGIKLNLPS